MEKSKTIYSQNQHQYRPYYPTTAQGGPYSAQPNGYPRGGYARTAKTSPQYRIKTRGQARASPTPTDGYYSFPAQSYPCDDDGYAQFAYEVPPPYAHFAPEWEGDEGEPSEEDQGQGFEVAPEPKSKRYSTWRLNHYAPARTQGPPRALYSPASPSWAHPSIYSVRLPEGAQ
eukprot:TRINITY_DN2715_c0_g1_i1.p1 TRINITY_DN2715_c0_g1~~TRINITY_DN2715_c0_g1_i1.p1  ORF type:complete len:172 (+),score=8.15 TRINITY_DN2715_c0_g1_i1:172-687(+)